MTVTSFGGDMATKRRAATQTSAPSKCDPLFLLRLTVWRIFTRKRFSPHYSSLRIHTTNDGTQRNRPVVNISIFTQIGNNCYFSFPVTRRASDLAFPEKKRIAQISIPPPPPLALSLALFSLAFPPKNTPLPYFVEKWISFLLFCILPTTNVGNELISIYT